MAKATEARAKAACLTAVCYVQRVGERCGGLSGCTLRCVTQDVKTSHAHGHGGKVPHPRKNIGARKQYRTTASPPTQL